MSVTGGCRCGAIRYEAVGDPVHSSLCFCADCRRSAGAQAVGWMLFAQSDVRIEGTPVDHESSPGTHRQFCGTCGTGLFYYNDGLFRGQVDIQSATLDDPAAVPPTARIQLADAPDWARAIDALPGFERFPPG